MPRQIMKRIVLLAVLAALTVCSPANADTVSRWQVLHLAAGEKPQWFHAARRGEATDWRFYKEGHRLNEGLSADSCRILAAGRGVIAISPCSDRVSLKYWGEGSLTVLFRFRWF